MFCGACNCIKESAREGVEKCTVKHLQNDPLHPSQNNGVEQKQIEATRKIHLAVKYIWL